ncbi:Uncharacterised protein [Halioglobus japonicus]|nr:Uncharacterised protein [Halioglobus japonicus]
MEALLAVFLPVYFLLFFGVAFLWRTWRTWKKTGLNAYTLMKNSGVEEVTNKYFRLLPFASALVMVVYLSGPSAYRFLAPFDWLEYTGLQVVGVTLMTVALAVMVIAQGQMGESWRIGVDHENPTLFVQRGLFRYSRNPIFLGIVLSVIGYFLLLPNAVTLLIMMLDLALVQVQVRVEEQHLEGQHGENYTRYCQAVRRWI